MKIKSILLSLFLTSSVVSCGSVAAAPQSDILTIPNTSYLLIGSAGDEFKRLQVSGGKSIYCYHQDIEPEIDIKMNSDISSAFMYSDLNINMLLDHNMYCRAMKDDVTILYQLN